MLSAVLPQNVRNLLRHTFDAAFCKSFPDKQPVGGASQWTMLTRDMRSDSVVYSGGVGEDISFELELIRLYGVRIHIFDPSPVGNKTIAKTLNNSEKLEKHLAFKPLGLAATSQVNFSIGGGNGETAWLRAATGDKSESVPCTTIPDELLMNAHDHIDLLKIDIEGFEYEVLQSCFEAKIPIKQICVEFHDFFPDIPKMKTFRAINDLRRRGFILVHKNRHDHTFYNSEYL
jgi:FkbM family methyltransferase